MGSAPESLQRFTAVYGGALARIQERVRRAGLTLPAKALDEALWRAVQAIDNPAPQAIAEYLSSLHAEDFALAAACRLGTDSAWERFISTYRPILYSAARAITRDEIRAREIADSLWADLYGLRARESAERQPLLDYFHGRSSLATWLRAVVARRYIDSVRAERHDEPLEATAPERLAIGGDPPDPQRDRWLALLATALNQAIAGLAPRDRLRMRYHYADGLKGGEIARLMDEREWTVSRGLKRSLRRLRAQVEQALAADGMSADQIRECYDYALQDWPFDLGGSELAAAGQSMMQQRGGKFRR